MRYKVAPEPADEDLLFAVRDAVPLVPGDVEDCCLRIADRTAVPSRDDAREWLTFCRALGLVANANRGYHRVRDDPDGDAVAENFAANVFGAKEVVDALEASDGPLDVDAAFAALGPAVPSWERERHPDWEAEWRGRTRRLLAWAAVFGYAERVGEGTYRSAVRAEGR
jgi:hypothetical protein